MDLRDFPWGRYGVIFAVLYGSRAWGGAVKGDWDVAAMLEDPEADIDLQYALARFLGGLEMTRWTS
ncbi:MAG: nucleotidyltransferase domain-containing protein [Thermoproteus sp.]